MPFSRPTDAAQEPVIRTVLQLRKGDPKGAKGAGANRSDFRAAVPATGAGDPGILAAFIADYVDAKGKQARPVNYIPVHLPFAEPELNFRVWAYKMSTNQVQIKCNGERIVGRQNEHLVFETGDFGACGYDDATKACKFGCAKPSGRLFLRIDALVAKGIEGLAEVPTTSEIDRNYLVARLVQLHEMFGDLRAVPLILYRKPTQITKRMKIDGKPVKKRDTDHPIFLDPDPAWLADRVKTLGPSWQLPAPVQHVALLPQAVAPDEDIEPDAALEAALHDSGQNEGEGEGEGEGEDIDNNAVARAMLEELDKPLRGDRILAIYNAAVEIAEGAQITYEKVEAPNIKQMRDIASAILKEAAK